MSRKRILVIEDDDLQYEIYEEALSDYEVVRARTGSESLAAVTQWRPDIILLDHVLDQGERGLDFLPALKELLPYVPIVVASGALEVQQQMEALQGPRRAHYCLAKPIDLNELRTTVKLAIEQCGEAEIVRQFEALERSKRADIENLLSRSSDRLSRQTEIRRRLEGQEERPNISALAREFKVARRTIIRDLRELIRRGEIAASLYPPWTGDAGREREEAG